MKIVFATNNAHKLSEIRQIVQGRMEILSLGDIRCHEEIPETAPTIEGNALQKARYVAGKYHVSCFADDTGLEVEALGGLPGVHTARYADEEGHDSERNMQKLLSELRGKENRKAQFRTAIALVMGGEEHLFEGIVSGLILQEKQGDKGFGYDPVFQPEGFMKSFAELGEDIKNQVSHRARATKKLLDFLLEGNK